MCGATSAQDQIQQEQMQQYQQMQEMTAQEFAAQQAIYGPMAAKFESIFNAGPNQKGFSDAETNDLNASAVEGTASNYKQAAKAVNENIAAQGGAPGMSNGASAQLRSEVATSAAAMESNEETQIKQADYNQGYSEWQAAGEGLLSIAAGDNPLGYANATTGAGSAASNTANEIAQENNSWLNAVIGAAGDIGGGLMGNPNLKI